MHSEGTSSTKTGPAKHKHRWIIICLMMMFLAAPLTMTAAQSMKGFPTPLSGAEKGHSVQLNSAMTGEPINSTAEEDIDESIYLPVLLKNFPPSPTIPTLNAISNPGGVGSYTVSWSASENTSTYILQEDDNSGFTSPSSVYSGAATSTSITGKGLGTYYYRVQASNEYNSSAWSNVESVLVTQETEVCPETTAWRGYTDDDWMFDFEIESTPQCQIKDSPELQIRFEDPCDAGDYIMAVFDYDIPIINNQFDTGSWNDARMIGDFTSPTTVSGTYSYDAGGACTTSGTWTAEYNIGTNATVSVLAVQSDGKILVGGGFTTLGGKNQYRIGRLNSDGSYDESFSTAYADDSVMAIALQSDGKIVVAGHFDNLNGTTRLKIGRLNADGSLDTSFNPNGSSFRDFWYISELAIDSNQKIVVGGLFDRIGSIDVEPNLARLNPDGSLDSTFAFEWVDVEKRTVTALAVQPDDKIIVGMRPANEAADDYGQRAPVYRLNADGTIETTLVTLRTYVVNYTPKPRAILIQDDGKIIVAGYFPNYDNLVQIDPNNSTEPVDDWASTNVDVLAIAAQPDGKILIGGGFTEINGETQYRIGRLNADGTRDASFGARADGSVGAIALQADGKIVMGGSFNILNDETLYYIGRLNSDGTLDTTFPQ